MACPLVDLKAECLVSWRGLDMTPKKPLLRSDLNDVRKDQALRSTQSTLKMQSRCQHEQAVASAVAGMGRFLCESCGHVSIKLVKEALPRHGIRKPRHEIHTKFL